MQYDGRFMIILLKNYVIRDNHKIDSVVVEADSLRKCINTIKTCKDEFGVEMINLISFYKACDLFETRHKINYGACLF
jgi:hypothetical protein